MSNLLSIVQEQAARLERLRTAVNELQSIVEANAISLEVLESQIGITTPTNEPTQNITATDIPEWTVNSPLVPDRESLRGLKYLLGATK